MRYGFVSLLVLSTALAQGLPELRIEPTNGGSVLFVKNTSTAQPLAAVLIALVDYPGSSYSLWQDEWSGEGGMIAPGTERRIPITNMTVGAVPDYVKLRAALYADGSTAGVPEKVELMKGRRKAQLEIARELIKRLEAAEELAKWAESLKPEGKPKYDSAPWVNRAGQYAFVMHFKARTAADVLKRVREAERMLTKSL